jgi:hypothetical protein
MPIIREILNSETEENDFENEIYQKLVEAQAKARSNPKWLSHDEVFSPLRRKIADYKPKSVFLL